MKTFVDKWLLMVNQPASSSSIQELPSHAESLCALYELSDGADFVGGAVLRLPDGSTSGGLSVLSIKEGVSLSSKLFSEDERRFAWACDGSGNLLTIDDTGIGFWDHNFNDVVNIARTIAGLERRLFLRNDDDGSLEISVDAALSVDDEASVQRAIEGMSDDEVEGLAHRAARFGAPRSLRVLVRRLQDPDIVRADNGDSLLMSAARGGSMACVKLLVSLGANVLHKNNRGHRADIVARRSLHRDVGSFLHALT